jgi:hypothetical protein
LIALTASAGFASLAAMLALLTVRLRAHRLFQA